MNKIDYNQLNSFTTIIDISLVFLDGLFLLTLLVESLEITIYPSPAIIERRESISNLDNALIDRFTPRPIVASRHINQASFLDENAEEEDKIDQLHTMLEKAGFPTGWIPKHFICPITFSLIDKTPLLTPETPYRFSADYLCEWVRANNSHPLTRNDLSLNQLKPDYMLEGKIKIFVKWALLHANFLQSLPPIQAQNHITAFVEYIDKLFSKKFETNPSRIIINRYTQQLIDKLVLNATKRESLNSLTAFSRELTQLGISPWPKLSIAQNMFSFYKLFNCSNKPSKGEIEQADHHLARNFN